MQDPVTGAFRPQENGYLNGKDGPSETLLKAFCNAVRTEKDLQEIASSSSLSEDNAAVCRGPRMDWPAPESVYLQGQRWGSAFPAPVACCCVHETPTSFFFQDTGPQQSSPEANSRTEIMGVLYETATPATATTGMPSIVDASAPAVAADDDANFEANKDIHGRDFFVDTNVGLYYAGDFCSTRLAGIEAAFLSGHGAAQHILDSS